MIKLSLTNNRRKIYRFILNLQSLTAHFLYENIINSWSKISNSMQNNGFKCDYGSCV